MRVDQCRRQRSRDVRQRRPLRRALSRRSGRRRALCIRNAGRDRRNRVVAREPEYLVRVAMGSPRDRARSRCRIVDDARVRRSGQSARRDASRAASMRIDLSMIGERACRPIRAFRAARTCMLPRVESGIALRVRHWERGVGLTMACGTGAVACAVHARSIEASLRHRSTSSFRADGSSSSGTAAASAFMTGPAVRVFDTEVRVESARALAHDRARLLRRKGRIYFDEDSVAACRRRHRARSRARRADSGAAGRVRDDPARPAPADDDRPASRTHTRSRRFCRRATRACSCRPTRRNAVRRRCRSSAIRSPASSTTSCTSRR